MTICAMAYKSPGCASGRARPRPVRRSCCPARVPGGTLRETVPPGVGRFDRRSEHRFPRRQWKVEVQVLAGDAIQRMRLDLDVEVEIAVASAVRALAAFARHTQLLAVGDALRDAHLDAPRNAMRHALLVVFEHVQVELDLRTLERLLEGEAHCRFVVAPRRTGRARDALRARRRPASPAKRSARSMILERSSSAPANRSPQSGGGRKSCPGA